MCTMISCFLCKTSILLNKDNIRIVKTVKGLNSFKNAAEEREDEMLIEFLANNSPPFHVHETCARNYTRQSTIKAFLKRKNEEDVHVCSPPKRRSESLDYNQRTNCLFCCLPIDDSTKLSIKDRRKSSQFKPECQKALILKFKETANKFIEQVKERYDRILAQCSDLGCANIQYHRDCFQFFLRSGRKVGDVETCGKSGRPINSNQSDAFQKLVEYLEECDQSQYSIQEIQDIFSSFVSDNTQLYTEKWLKTKLIHHFGDKIVMTNWKNSSIITFKENAYSILKEEWRKKKMNDEEEKLCIIDMAAAIIRESIRAKAYNMDEYPDMTDLNIDLMNEDIPMELYRFMNGIIKSKSRKKCNISERRKSVLSHCIISSCRPRSFISSIMLSLSIYVYKKFESRELVDIINSLGYGEDYNEVKIFLSSVMATPSYVDQLMDLGSKAFTQFVFDNADWNMKNDIGNNSWHVMGGIAAVSPINVLEEKVKVKRSKKNVENVIKHFIPIQELPKPENKLSAPKTVLNPLPSTCLSKKGCTVSDLNTLWMLLCCDDLNTNSFNTPGWGGFMCKIFNNSMKESIRSKIFILPFTLGLPSDLRTIFSDLMYARDKNNMKALLVTFDQPLYIKAVKIVYNFPDLFSKCLIKLGEFHLIMSYLGSVGYLMSGSGLNELWETVYGKSSVISMIEGHAYTRSVTAHRSTMVALFHNMLDCSQDFNNISLDSIKTLLKKIEENLCNSEEISGNDYVVALREKLISVKDSLKSRNLTSHLWITYFEMVSLLEMFIASIRLGDLELYQYCISNMIPIFHAAGRFQYAKCTRLFLQNLMECVNWMSEEEYHKFIDEGRAVIRRFDRKWGGNEADKVIEQDLMRVIKCKGGLTRGRGITDSTMERFTNSLPATVPICESLEQFCNIISGTSEQHKDLRPMFASKLGNINKKFVEWFQYHPPFPEESLVLMNIANGIVADNDVNCYKAFEIGLEGSKTVDHVIFSEVKLSNKHKAITIDSRKNSIKCRDQVVEINPHILFHRICCVIEDKSEMEEYLSFELCQQPPSLFKDGVMRKGQKSDLGKIIKSSVQCLSFKGMHVVVDGCYFLYTGEDWKKGSTFHEICQTYVKHLISFNLKITVIFDGYGSCSFSTKKEVQNSRSKGNASKTYIFDENMKLQVSKASFLRNYENKSRFIKLLIPMLQCNGIDVKQASADADYLIASTCLQLSIEVSVWCLSVDTDILIMFVAKVHTNSKGIYFGSSSSFCYDMLELRNALPPMMNNLILIAHALSDNDTVSNFYKKSKSTIFEIIKNDPCSFQYLLHLHKADCQPEQVAKIVEKFIISLYCSNMKSENFTLDKLRYEIYNRIIGHAKLTSDFDLALLPPTSAAARQHSFRVYHTLQQWQGIVLDPCQWGWTRHNGEIKPCYTNNKILPDKLAKMISCGCKTNCGKRCGCRKFGNYCSILCKNCNGTDCLNVPEFNEN